MPVKRRASKQLAHKITDEAVQAYVAGNEGDVHRTLGLKPWQYSPLPTVCTPLGVDDGEPSPSDAPATRDSWYLAQDLQAALEAEVKRRGLVPPRIDHHAASHPFPDDTDDE